MSKFRPLIPFLFAAVTLAACSSQPSQQTRAEMEAESARAFNQMRASMPLVTDRETIDFVACVAQSVVEVLEPPFNDIEWELAIFEEGAVNAFAMPGGKIGVFSGLLKVTENQDQLATVIGHEVAHVLAHHSNERVSQQFAVEQSLGLISALSSPQTETGRTMMGLLGVGAQYGILMPYNRVQESEADRLGLNLMARAGFNPAESIILWRNMSTAGGAQPPEFLSTHPSHSTRISGLSAILPNAQRLQRTAQQQGKRPACK